MPTMDPDDRRSYRLTPAEVGAVWGLSGELLGLVEVGLAGALAAGRAVSEDQARAAFDARQGRSKPYVLDLLGFARARPLRRSDRALLAERMMVDEAVLDAGESPSPVDLYEVSWVIERTRYAMGSATRRRLVLGLGSKRAPACVDPARCFALMGMATTLRPTVTSLRRILHSAWRSDSVAAADRLVVRWPDAIGRRKVEA